MPTSVWPHNMVVLVFELISRSCRYLENPTLNKNAMVTGVDRLAHLFFFCVSSIAFEGEILLYHFQPCIQPVPNCSRVVQTYQTCDSPRYVLSAFRTLYFFPRSVLSAIEEQIAQCVPKRVPTCSVQRFLRCLYISDLQAYINEVPQTSVR
jgi:hypothetical protein